MNRKTKAKIKNFFNKINKAVQGFNTIAKLIMLVVCIGTGILSVYYTGTYMAGIIENRFIAYLVSGTMYAFGLIGLNYAGVFKEQRKYILAFIFSVTALCTILFSMSTSLMVNGEKYYTKHVEAEQITTSNNASNNFKFELLKEEMSSNKELIANYQEDIKFQQTQNTADYGNVKQEDGSVKWLATGTYSLTRSAQLAIEKDKEEIEKLNKRNQEILKELSDIASVSSVLLSKTDSVETFTQLISKYLKIDANYIQLFMILFCSVFIDIISPLALMIAKNKEDGKEIIEERKRLKIEKIREKSNSKKEKEELISLLNRFEKELEE